MQRRRFQHWLAGSALFAATPLLRAQNPAWPDRPVRWLLSQPPGSGPDNVARILSDRLAKAWGQAVVIDNKPGGQNTVGALAAARAPADGHSFYFATTAALITNPLLFKTLPYDPAKDFVPVAFIARSPFGLLVRAESPVTSVDELVARSKAAPGTLPGFDMVGWFALVAPTGTPAAVIARANRDINALLADKSVAERIATIGPLVDASMGPQAVGAILQREAQRWQAIAQEIGVLPE